MISPGSPVAIMSAPAAGTKREIVVEGTTSSNLTAGPGHERDNRPAWPAGSRDDHGSGAPVRCAVPSRSRRCTPARRSRPSRRPRARRRTRSLRREGASGDQGPAPLPQGAGGLLLITSDSSGLRSGWAPSNTVYVDAAQTSTPLGTSPDAGVASITKAEMAMQTNLGIAL